MYFLRRQATSLLQSRHRKAAVMTYYLKTAGQVVSSAFTSKLLEKPEHTVLQKQEGYEERCYNPSVWVSTRVKNISRKPAGSTGFQRLFKYITGANVPEKKIDMTAPVAVKVEPGQGPNCESTFTVSFYVGKQHWADVPQPTNPDVFIEQWPEIKVYSRQFGGFADDDTWISETRNLCDSLKDKSDFEQEFYFTAGYDAPFRMFNRTNEVWFVKKEESR